MCKTIYLNKIDEKSTIYYYIFAGEFTCCGGYGYATGYTDWKHTLLGGGHNSVPDSCCLRESPGCGVNVFGVTDLRVTIQKIHLHGCLTIMMVRLETHVKVSRQVKVMQKIRIIQKRQHFIIFNEIDLFCYNSVRLFWPYFVQLEVSLQLSSC